MREVTHIPSLGGAVSPEERQARLGKTQRLLSLRSIEALQRSPIGKVLQRHLRELHGPV